ncbi:hypothetical protein BC835DRAFT_211951 [Cytidiella melzeri]|nr:hypothetical protein BC835DRAFT_211951 [Cytidiella melzeri]
MVKHVWSNTRPTAKSIIKNTDGCESLAPAISPPLSFLPHFFRSDVQVTPLCVHAAHFLSITWSSLPCFSSLLLSSRCRSCRRPLRERIMKFSLPSLEFPCLVLNLDKTPTAMVSVTVSQTKTVNPSRSLVAVPHHVQNSIRSFWMQSTSPDGKNLSRGPTMTGLGVTRKNDNRLRIRTSEHVLAKICNCPIESTSFAAQLHALKR